MRKKVELLAPAGNLERLKWALMYGADAVYIGGREFSLRANATNFSIEEIKEACLYAKKLNKKVYVTVNIIFHNEDYKNLEEYLIKLDQIGVDAIIIADLFIIDLVEKLNLSLKIHISTQTSSLNDETIKFYKQYKSVERVVLGRETSRSDIKDIIDKTSMEVECFIHGAMCAGYSGRCVLSNYFTLRDANRGGCSQICRFEFPLLDKNMNEISNQTFSMSQKDLSMASYLTDMIDIGITSFKIEGRMRSNYYIATVVNTYRSLIDEYYNNTLTKKKLKEYERILDRSSNRDSICQFYNHLPSIEEAYFSGRNEVSNQDFLGIVISYDEYTKTVTLSQRNFFKKGDVVEIFGPTTKSFSFKIPNIYDEDNNLLEAARHPEQIIKFKLNKKVYQYDILRIKI